MLFIDRERAFKVLFVLAALVLILCVARPAFGQTAADAPSAVKGLAFAKRFCSNCHLVDDAAGASVPAGIPSFRSIANRPDQTGQRITDKMINPHPPMPDIQLSSVEMLDIIAYMDELRFDKTTPLLSPAIKLPPKPKLPEPS